MPIRGKFTCNSIELTPSWQHKGKQTHLVKFTAVGDDGTPENQRYSSSTPCGNINITVDNPDAQVFEPGKDYFVDFTPAD